MFNIILIVLIAAVISIWAERKIEETIPMSVCGIILFFYAFAICGIMGMVVYALLTATLVALALYVWLRCKRNGRHVNLVQMLFTPGLFGFVILSVFLWYFSKDLVPTSWDEFSHWALTTKDMYYTDQLSSNIASVTKFKTYPPALAIFEYFFSYD